MKLKVLSVAKSGLLFNGTWVETAQLSSDDGIHGTLFLRSHDHSRLNPGDTLHVEIEAAPVVEPVVEPVPVNSSAAERRAAQRRVEQLKVEDIPRDLADIVERAEADRRVAA